MLTLLIDGDIVMYRACFACEKNKYTLIIKGVGTFEFDNRRDLNDYVKQKQLEEYEIVVESVIEPLEYALGNIDGCLQKIINNLKPDKVRVFLTGKGNYRYDIAVTAPYKGNRDRTKRPHWTQEAREFLVSKWGAEIVNGMEADDALGINQTQDTIICSTDKDLNQIPGKHYHFVDERYYELPPGICEYYFLTQMLTGDKSDNIMGLSRIGIARADKILGPLPEQHVDRAKDAYKKEFKDKWEQRWSENEGLLRICRDGKDLERFTKQAASVKSAAREARGSS